MFGSDSDEVDTNSPQYKRRMMDWGSSKIADAIYSELTRNGIHIDFSEVQNWVDRNIKRDSAFFSAWDKVEDPFGDNTEYAEIPEGAFVIWERVLPTWNRTYFIPKVQAGFNALKPKPSGSGHYRPSPTHHYYLNHLQKRNI